MRLAISPETLSQIAVEAFDLTLGTCPARAVQADTKAQAVGYLEQAGGREGSDGCHRHRRRVPRRRSSCCRTAPPADTLEVVEGLQQ